MTFPDYLLQPHGTSAAYRRHRRRGEDACVLCKEAEARRHGTWTGREAYNDARRERYAAAIAAGLSKAEANAVRDRSAACPS